MCYVVLHDHADAQQVRQTIVSMPDYFADYDTQVHFISMEELQRDHAQMPHGGFVIRSGVTGMPTSDLDAGLSQVMEFSLNLQSNPQFTASVLVAYARACHRLYQKQDFGAKTIYDIPPGLISPCSPADLRKRLL